MATAGITASTASAVKGNSVANHGTVCGCAALPRQVRLLLARSAAKQRLHHRRPHRLDDTKQVLLLQEIKIKRSYHFTNAPYIKASSVVVLKGDTSSYRH